MPSLEAPHRIAGAILREGQLETGETFRQSAHGQRLSSASAHNVTGLCEICPTAVVLGLSDSTGPRGGLGVKLPRATASEIVGVGYIPGRTTSSRLDLLRINRGAGPIFEAENSQAGWVIDERAAKPD